MVTYPISLALMMPIFLQHFVMEKEKKLVYNMKINGLKMYNYWFINGCFNFCCYATTTILFVFFGRYVFNLDFFSDTHMFLFVEVYFMWGLVQVSMPMFFCCLFSSAQSASMTGYAATLWTCTIAANITMSVFAVPRRFPQWMMYYPNFAYVRSIYLLLDPCTWDTCLGDFEMAPTEFHEMIFWMFFDSIAYLLISIYLNEVIPQEYGVSKHPLFLV